MSAQQVADNFYSMAPKYRTKVRLVELIQEEIDRLEAEAEATFQAYASNSD